MVNVIEEITINYYQIILEMFGLMPPYLQELHLELFNSPYSFCKLNLYI
jgi:hypothetical protein